MQSGDQKNFQAAKNESKTLEDQSSVQGQLLHVLWRPTLVRGHSMTSEGFFQPSFLYPSKIRCELEIVGNLEIRKTCPMMLHQPGVLQGL